MNGVENECVQTGVRWRTANDARVRTGDLKWTPGAGWHVTGIPHGAREGTRCDVMFNDPVSIAWRGESPFGDTLGDLLLLAATPAFVEHCRKWAPWVHDIVSQVAELT
jgi:hypothetical protein